VIEPVVEGDIGEAWNRGARRAHGEVLIFLHENAPRLELVDAHLHVHRRHDRAVGLGSVEPDRRGEPRPAEVCGRSCSVRRTDFSEAGGFMQGVPWGADLELVHRLKGRGLRLVRVHEEFEPAPSPEGLSKLAARRAAAGRASVALYRRRPELLPELELGAFGDGGPKGRVLRRTLLALGGPVWPLRLGALLIPKHRRASWQRFLESYLYWRGVWQAVPDADTRRRLAHAPMVLMYHAIGEPGERPGCYVVPLRRFKAQLAWLRLAGYRIVGMEHLVGLLRTHQLAPARSVALTFDDGYRDNHRLAWPVLRSRRLPAMFFLVSGRMGQTNLWDRTGELAGRPLMSWDEAIDLVRSGMEVGAHTRHHPALPGLSGEHCNNEIVGSRVDLEERLGIPVRVFAYPYGLLDESSVDAVMRAGFEGACGCRSGPNDPGVSLYELRRLEIRGTDSLSEFALALWRRSRPRPAGTR